MRRRRRRSPRSPRRVRRARRAPDPRACRRPRRPRRPGSAPVHPSGGQPTTACRERSEHRVDVRAGHEVAVRPDRRVLVVAAPSVQRVLHELGERDGSVIADRAAYRLRHRLAHGDEYAAVHRRENPGVVDELRLAASVVAGRDGAGGLELLVIERSRSSRFLPGYVAFPGRRHRRGRRGAGRRVVRHRRRDLARVRHPRAVRGDGARGDRRRHGVHRQLESPSPVGMAPPSPSQLPEIAHRDRAGGGAGPVRCALLRGGGVRRPRADARRLRGGVRVVDHRAGAARRARRRHAEALLADVLHADASRHVLDGGGPAARSASRRASPPRRTSNACRARRSGNRTDAADRPCPRAQPEHLHARGGRTRESSATSHRSSSTPVPTTTPTSRRSRAWPDACQPSW